MTDFKVRLARNDESHIYILSQSTKQTKLFSRKSSNVSHQIQHTCKVHLLRVINTKFECISESKLQDIYDIALESESSMQVLVSLATINISSARILTRETRGIKTLLETEKEQRIKWEQECKKLNIILTYLIYGVCVNDVIKHLPDKLAEFYKVNSHIFNVPSSLVSKSPQADNQWSILYSKKNLKKAQTDLQDFIDGDVDSIKGTYNLLL
eukprot:NODE_311_length_11244_cov_0.423419.p5 type:complete len:211 gc:universal NODE_311_length_11244_cov_0.423419:10211-10843(+)